MSRLQIYIPRDEVDDLRELRKTDTCPVGTAIASPERSRPIVHILPQAELTKSNWHMCTHSRM